MWLYKNEELDLSLHVTIQDIFIDVLLIHEKWFLYYKFITDSQILSDLKVCISNLKIAIS
jgi:hypothetical protein